MSNSISVNDIHEQLEEAFQENGSRMDLVNPGKLEILLAHYSDDPRPQVGALIEKYRSRQLKDAQEFDRLTKMRSYEEQYEHMAGARYICGIDEVGRGPLAGPVVAGAVILPQGCRIRHINDSKKLSEKRREELYDVIMEEALAVGIGMVSPERIDEINILQATYEAMREAISNLKIRPDILLNDAVTIPMVDIPQIPIIKGDSKSISIASASIIAKVTRDRMMVEYDKIFPGYGFESNKGYGSAAHIQALKDKGATVIHRQTFITHFIG